MRRQVADKGFDIHRPQRLVALMGPIRCPIAIRVVLLEADQRAGYIGALDGKLLHDPFAGLVGGDEG